MKMGVGDPKVRTGILVVVGLVAVCASLPVWAAEPAASEPLEEPPDLFAADVIVSATRTPTSIGNVNQSVTIVTEEQIQQQIAASPGRSLSQILPKLVPGLSQNDGSMDSGTSQTIRGRQIAVLIDGVPQLSSPTVQFDLAHIDPSAIERIEVVRGATAIYGNGGTGGLINIITKQAGEGKPSFHTEVQGSGSLTRVLRGLSGTVVQGFQGKKDWFDYNIVGSFNQQGGMFDAEGSRTMPGTNGVGGFADTKTYNILSKFGATFGEHRLQLTFNRKESRQDTNYVVDPNVDTFPRTTARFVPGLALDEQPKLVNSQVSVDYSHPHLFLDSRVHIQGYYRNQQTRFPTLDDRLFGGTDIVQGLVQTDVLGTRAEITTPIPVYGKPQVTWGMDFSSQHGVQNQNLYNPTIFDATGGRVFTKTGQNQLLPARVFQSAAAFAQGEWTPISALVFRGGLRYERLGISSSDFTDSLGTSSPASSIRFDATVFNAGFVYHLNDPLDLFFNFSQGFNVPVGSIDGALSVTPGTAIQLTKLQPQRVNNYEVGLRGKWSKVQTSLSGYISKSSLGLAFDQFTNSLHRAPQTIYGVEATLDVQPYEGWRIGGTYTFVEGDQTISSNPDVRVPINGFNIQPQKVTGYLEYLAVPEWQWRNRLQVLYSASRTRSLTAFTTGLDPSGDPFSMREYFVVDFMSTVKAGPGTLRFGIENLLNQKYVVAFNQIQSLNSFNYAARGATVTIGYSMTY
ncbi:TonB-dependent receptor [Nitrospira lenta]|uniref:TonB-dependent receptor n=1 Tax=Nitrospira lenta TaxID=1436998 RepID=A0A330L3C6_9BACT|nr:TonB-dependent receptor [Nitrospira lenta]SPP63723.1 TonB-dependent receptor [Nitrospira lenta]